MERSAVTATQPGEFAWYWNVRTVALYAGIAVLFIAVAVIGWLRRGNGPRPRRGLVLLTMLGLATAGVTLLPLPPRAAGWCAANGIDTLQLIPFHWMVDARWAAVEVGLLSWPVFATIAQYIANVALFTLFGFIVRRDLGWGAPRTILAGVGLSLLIEATQVTGLWFVYDCAYRQGDVDDLIANALGAVIAVLLTRRCTARRTGNRSSARSRPSVS